MFDFLMDEPGKAYTGESAAKRTTRRNGWGLVVGRNFRDPLSVLPRRGSSSAKSGRRNALTRWPPRSDRWPPDTLPPPAVAVAGIDEGDHAGRTRLSCSGTASAVARIRSPYRVAHRRVC